MLELRFSSIIFADAPATLSSAPDYLAKYVLKRISILLSRIQNFEKIFITFRDTVRNVKKLFENFSKPEPKFYIENSVQMH